jgi:hypothetical protein
MREVEDIEAAIDGLPHAEFSREMGAKAYKPIGVFILASLGTACFVVGCSVQQPEKTVTKSDKTDRFSMKVKCADVGRRYTDDLAKGGEKLGNSPINPRFAYNLDLNTCIVRAGYLSRSGRYIFIADVLTGETLFEMFGNDPGKQSDFDQAETRLMGPSESDLAGTIVKSPPKPLR